MKIDDFRKLHRWQLSHALRKEVNAICDAEAVRHDRKFCDGFRDAVGSACRNISEGFRRGGSCEIVQFFGDALASLGETQDYLEECVVRNLIDGPTHERLRDLSEHARATTIKFRKPHAERWPKTRRRR
jgi:four helix bundle protein